MVAVSAGAIGGNEGERPTNKRGMRIRNATDRKVLSSVMRIALSKGERAVTMEAVSRDSGVAKTTLYRRYKNRKDMLSKLDAQISGYQFDVNNFEPSREGLEEYVRQLQDTYERYVGIANLGSLLSAKTPFLHHLASEIIVKVRMGMAELIARGQELGTFPEETDAQMAADSIIGGMVCGAYSSGVLPKGWAHRMIALLFPFGRLAKEDRAERKAALKAAEHMTPQVSIQAAEKAIDAATGKGQSGSGSVQDV